jgi:cobalt-zinc-cadmium efflux system protein
MTEIRAMPKRHEHENDLKAQSQTRLWWALVVNAFFFVVEVIGGVVTHSLALLADAAHMLTDIGALSLAIFVAHLARKAPTPERTFGLLRAEVLGAFINGAALILIVGMIFREAWYRFGEPQVVRGPLMLAVAVVGLLANLASAAILWKGREDNLNVQGAFLHMAADTLGSGGAIVAGSVIWLTGWYPIDSLASVVIGLLILWSSWRFLKRTTHILLQATPEDIDFLEVKQALEEDEHIEKVHDLHIWAITSGSPVLSAHLLLAPCCTDSNHWPLCLAAAKKKLKERFNIVHATLQVETAPGECRGPCPLDRHARPQ